MVLENTPPGSRPRGTAATRARATGEIFLPLSNKYFLAATHHGEAGGSARECEDGELVGGVAGSPPPRILLAGAEVEGAEHLASRRTLCYYSL